MAAGGSVYTLTRAASLAKQARDKKLTVKSEFTVTPGSELIRYTVERDGRARPMKVALAEMPESVLL